MVEDAVSGVAAAKAGGHGGLGVARSDDRALLEAAADLAVSSLDQVDIPQLAARWRRDLRRLVFQARRDRALRPGDGRADYGRPVA